ncbi:MAG: Lrp/AsnC family transcriptional regulator [Rhodocyclaceae bacterium]|nr:MAG: Lrp/AsnC family transcriptional regulator [Rhodocyclaceae bacterium]
MSASSVKPSPQFDATDRRLVVATQGGLPLTPRPYHHIAEQLGLTPEEVMQRLAAMVERGAIRRIGAVPNHYAIGYTANGMSVWDIDDAVVDNLGERVGQLEAVTHCYRRPRHAPQWHYNLFAMVHGHSREEVSAQVDAIARLLETEFPGACRARDILYSTRILKKTGLRISG